MHLIQRLAKAFLILILGLLVFYGVARQIVVYIDSELDGERAPYIQMTTPGSAVIRWQTLTPSLGTVGIGEQHYHQKQQLTANFTEAAPTRLHSVTVDQLKPDTLYYYQISDDQGRHAGGSVNDWFRTAPVTARPTRIWVIGDSGDPGPVLDQVRDAALQWTRQHSRVGLPDFDVWLSLGDLAYRSGSDKQFQKSLFDAFPDQMRNTALWPTYGNHDARRRTYFRLFSLPEHGEAGGEPSGTENYYSFNFGAVHFVMLDSEASSNAPGSDMVNWLQRDLEKNTSPWLIAVFHHPPYSKGTHDSDVNRGSSAPMVEMRENIVPLLEAAGVDLVLSGHSHMYERSYLLDCHYGNSKIFTAQRIVSDGVNHQNAEYLKPLQKTPHAGAVYVVAGSASKVDGGPINHPAMPVSMLEAGSLMIDIDGDELIARFINNKSEVKDMFSIRKQAGYRSGYAGCVTGEKIKD